MLNFKIINSKDLVVTSQNIQMLGQSDNVPSHPW